MSEVAAVEVVEGVTATPVVRTDGKDTSATALTATPGAANSALKETPKAGDGVDPNHPCAAHVQVLDAEAGTVASSGRKKIAICGFASSSRHLVPVDDPTWEVWGLNQLYRHVKRADRWFDIHHNWQEEVVPGTDHRAWIDECGIPCYMMTRPPGLRNAVRYPVERIITQQGADYFTSTIAFMVALAIDEIDAMVDAQIAAQGLPLDLSTRKGLAKVYGEYSIAVFGVDLVVGEEYFWQKACAEYWVGVGSARGINMVIPAQSALCRHLFRYGYQSEPDIIIKESEIKSHAKHLADTRGEKLKELYMLDGALQVDEYWGQLIELRLRGAQIKV